MGAAPSLITPGIWQGGASVMKDEEWFAEHRITHIVSLGDRTPDPSILATRKHLHYDVDDMPDVELRRHFVEAINFVHDARVKESGVVYIHCMAGVSRSSTITLAYLMSHLDVGFVEALKYLRLGRDIADPNEGFVEQLLAFEQDIGPEGMREMHRLLHQHPSAPDLREQDLAFFRQRASQPKLADNSRRTRFLTTLDDDADDDDGITGNGAH